MISQSSTFLCGLIHNKRFYHLITAYQHSNFFEHVKIYLKENKQMCSFGVKGLGSSYPHPDASLHGRNLSLDEQCLSLGEGKC